LESCDPILKDLESQVSQHYDRHPTKPLLLSRYGADNPELNAELKRSYGSLGNAIKSASAAGLGIWTSKEKLGGDYIGHIKFTAPNGESGHVTAKPTLFKSLPNSIKIAFCASLEDGQVIAVKITPPFKYQKFAANADIPDDYFVIDDAYRTPGVPVKDAERSKSQELEEGFSEWLSQNGLDASIFTKRNESGKERARSRDASALERFLSSQEKSILKRIVIPADIVELLSRN
jgi:hypothetical protein